MPFSETSPPVYTRALASATDPPALTRAFDLMVKLKIEEPHWPVHTEEWYWEILVQRCPFVSVYASDNRQQPLIDVSPLNLSQTPREQCEINGFILEESDLSLDGPGKSVRVQGLVSQPQLNGCIGRVLALSGRGSPNPLPSATRVAVRLSDLQTISCRPENLVYCPFVATPPVLFTREALLPQPKPSRPTMLPRQTEDDRTAIAELVRAYILQDGAVLVLDRPGLRRFLSEPDIGCDVCGSRAHDGYLAISRIKYFSTDPMPYALQLRCVDCIIDVTQKGRVLVNAKSVQDFVNFVCMPPAEAATYRTPNDLTPIPETWKLMNI